MRPRPSPPSIAAKWNIVSDTIFSGVNTGVNPAIYTGQSGDYFDFRTDGHLYIKEGAALDTLSYNVIAWNKVSIIAFSSNNSNISDTCQVAGFTHQHADIVSSLLTPPAGPQQRKVGLSR